MKKTWALKLVGRHTLNDKKLGPVINFPRTVKLLQAEHARTVRIVKRKIRGLEACIASDKRDGNEAGATLHVYALSILNSTLADMQKGRA